MLVNLWLAEEVLRFLPATLKQTFPNEQYWADFGAFSTLDCMSDLGGLNGLFFTYAA